jgi:hypothetical protein
MASVEMMPCEVFFFTNTVCSFLSLVGAEKGANGESKADSAHFSLNFFPQIPLPYLVPSPVVAFLVVAFFFF